ncbi:hypothetical protein [uncultured Chitinophaga sp.]|jgi:hypothetical protein|uniref:hypothetical protein n=1 Tax=uncultured Chitinophaga sp. TaxID=339340 RepID=UPI0026279698|nr:hypothetical protein [uncultured Chitinophaga sp.]
MPVPPAEQSHLFHTLGVGPIQLGKKPQHVAGLIPLSECRHRHLFMVLPDVSRFYIYNGALKGRLENQQTDIDIRFLLAGINEVGFINSIFVYPLQVNNRIADRLCQIYGEPDVGLGSPNGKAPHTRHFWVTEGETEICYLGSSQETGETAVIVFRFFYDLDALKHFTIALKH